jgi:hypothetical protein
MRTISKIMIATGLAAVAGVPIAAPADAHKSRYRHHHYHGKTVYAYRSCRYSSGATGLVAGGVGGALVGRSVIGHGVLGTVGGAVGGAIAGRAIDRSMTARHRCRVRW